jgi:hypothetical protein
MSQREKYGSEISIVVENFAIEIMSKSMISVNDVNEI